MKKLLSLFTFFFLMVIPMLMAQSSVSGTVTDSDGAVLPGATVVVEGTSQGTTTDFDGNYSISASAGDVLVFSYVGYVSQSVEVGSSMVVNVSLESSNTLDEVVVTAYGSQTKESIVGSVAVIGADVLEASKATSVTQALQGAVPGVNIITSGGIPGSNPTIRIRGIGSINASASPLIIVDNAPYNGNLNGISQDQVESISVLKDASATALYGAAAANGVIVITTKSGKLNQEAKISVNIKKGIASEAVDLHETLGINDWSELYWEAKRNGLLANGTAANAAEAASLATSTYGSALQYNAYGIANPVGTDGRLTAAPLWDTDWKGAIINDEAQFEEVGISLSGGGNKTTYFFSTNYSHEEGNVETTVFERYASRIKIDSQVNDFIKAGMNVGYTRSHTNTPNQSGSGYSSTIQWIYNVPNYFPIYRRNADGSFKLDAAGNKIFDYGNYADGAVNVIRPVFLDENAYGSLFIYDIFNNRTDFNASLYADVNILSNLKFSSRVTYQSYMFDSYSYIDRDNGYAASVNGRVTQGRDITTATNAIQQLVYNETFADKHNIELDLLYVANNYHFDDLGASGEGFLPNVKILNGATTPSDVSGFTVQQRYTNALGRLKYNFDEKYFIEGSISSGLSTKFRDEVREGTFYSVGASWIASKENFLKDVDAIDFLKFKASYGEVGNDRGIGSFPYISTFNTGWNQLGTTGVLAGGLVDADLTWETTATTNAGIEFGLFGGKLDGGIEYYSRESVDLIYDKPLPISTGNSSITTNVGSLKNYGVEVTLSSQIVNSDDLKVNAALNFSTENNEITELTQEEFISGTKKWMVGRSLYDFFIREYAGVDPADGYVMWYKDVTDADGNVTGRETTKEYSDATRYYQDKLSIPDIIGGFQANVQYKNFDFSMLMNFSMGSFVYDSSYAGLMDGFSDIRQQSPHLLDRWQNPGDVTEVPVLLESNNDFNATSTRFLFSNDYLRIKGLTVGYTVKDSPVLSGVGINSVRVYAQATNPFTFHKHFGIDPEQNLSGTTSSRSYQLKTFTLGLNIDL